MNVESREEEQAHQHTRIIIIAGIGGGGGGGGNDDDDPVLLLSSLSVLLLSLPYCYFCVRDVNTAVTEQQNKDRQGAKGNGRKAGRK